MKWKHKIFAGTKTYTKSSLNGTPGTVTASLRPALCQLSPPPQPRLMVPPTATDSAVTHDARGGAGAVAAAAGPWRAKRRCPRWRGRPLAAGLGLGPGRAGPRAPRGCSWRWAPGSPPPATRCSTSSCSSRSGAVWGRVGAETPVWGQGGPLRCRPRCAGG